MNDIVALALAQQNKAGGNPAASWTVHFVNGAVYSGTIRPHNSGCYALVNSIGPIYFASDKVAFLHLEV